MRPRGHLLEPRPGRDPVASLELWRHRKSGGTGGNQTGSPAVIRRGLRCAAGKERGEEAAGLAPGAVSGVERWKP